MFSCRKNKDDNIHKSEALKPQDKRKLILESSKYMNISRNKMYVDLLKNY